VHMRISSPPTTGPCFYGVDTPTHKELIASSHSIEEIRAFIGADSLGYLDEEGLYTFVRDGESRSTSFCDACFTGRYPVPVLPDGVRGVETLPALVDRAAQQMELAKAGHIGEIRLAIRPGVLEVGRSLWPHAKIVHGNVHVLGLSKGPHAVDREGASALDVPGAIRARGLARHARPRTREPDRRARR